MANEPRFEVYPRRRVQTEKGDLAPDEFGWRFRAANGEISAIGGEGFTTEDNAERAVAQFYRDLVFAMGFGIVPKSPEIVRVDRR